VQGVSNPNRQGNAYCQVNQISDDLNGHNSLLLGTTLEIERVQFARYSAATLLSRTFLNGFKNRLNAARDWLTRVFSLEADWS
jgi:hypothetical protein